MRSFISELTMFLIHRRKFWLLPVVIVMALLGGLMVLTEGSALSPLIYTIF
jgi:hypothetical protein